MSQRLSDEAVADIREKVAAGAPKAVIAAAYCSSVRHLNRIVAGESRLPLSEPVEDGAALAAVEEFFQALTSPLRISSWRSRSERWRRSWIRCAVLTARRRLRRRRRLRASWRRRSMGSSGVGSTGSRRRRSRVSPAARGVVAGSPAKGDRFSPEVDRPSRSVSWFLTAS